MGEYLLALVCISPVLILLAVLLARLESRDQGGGEQGSQSGRFRITSVGDGYVEFEHPESGSWSYGLNQDISSVHGVTSLEKIGPGRYRAHVDRNPGNAAKVLQAAHDFRTSGSAGNPVYLNDRPGWDVLADEANYDLD